jgi:hypothetical protein
MLEKVGKEQLHRSCEKLLGIKEGRKVLRVHIIKEKEG